MNRYFNWIRITALAIICTFTFQNLSYCFGNSTIGALSAETPFGLKAIQDIQKFNPSKPELSLPDVWIIEDIHSSTGAQLQISRIIDTLLKLEPKSLIGMEGHAGPVAIQFLKAFPDIQIRTMAAYALLRQAKISAAEYAAITSSDDVQVFGTENERLYESDWNIYRRTQHKIANFAPLYKKISVLISRMEKDILSRDLQRWMKVLHKLDDADQDGGWAEDLRQAIKKLHAVGVGSHELQLLLEEKISPDSISTQDWLNQINRTLEQIIQLEAKSALELKTVRLIGKLRQIARVLNLKASREDYLQIRDMGEDYLPSILKTVSTLSRTNLYGLFSSEEQAVLENHLREALLFYLIAIMREKAMVINLQNALQTRKLKTGVLVVGGFHTMGLIREFRKMNLSTLVLRPKNFTLAEDRAYSARTFKNESKHEIQTQLTQILYGMFGAAVLKGYNLEKLKQIYLLASETSPARKPSKSKASPAKQPKTKTSKIHSVQAVNAPTVLRQEMLPTAAAIQSMTVLERNRSSATFVTSYGALKVSLHRGGQFTVASIATKRSEIRYFEKIKPVLGRLLMGGILLTLMSACSSVSPKKSGRISDGFYNPYRTKAVKVVAPKPESVKFELPPLEEPTLPVRRGANETVGLLPALDLSASQDLFQLTEAQLGTGSVDTETQTDNIDFRKYDSLPRIQIVSALTKTDSCPLCNLMTAQEMQKLKEAGAVGEMNPYTIDYPKPEDALAALKDKKKSWVDRYKAIINLITHHEKKGILLAHEILKSNRTEDPYGFWRGESVRILRANAPQWMVMVGPNRSDLETIIRYGLNDTDNLVRFMSLEALRKAAGADKDGIFSEALRKEAGARIIQIAQEDPDLFARYGAYLAMPQVIGLDQSVRFIRYGLENEKDYYVLKAVVQSANEHPSEAYTEGFLELLKRQPPEKTPGLIRAWEELKLQVRGGLLKLLAIDAFHDGVRNALLRKFALNDMYSVTVGIKNSLHEYAALLIEAEGTKDAAESLRSWLSTGRNLPLRELAENAPVRGKATQSKDAHELFKKKLETQHPEAFQHFMEKAFLETPAVAEGATQQPAKRPNTAFLSEVLVGPGMHRDFRALAAHLIGENTAIDGEKSLVAALADPGASTITAALQALTQIEIWKIDSGFIAYDPDFTRGLIERLTLLREGKRPVTTTVYEDWVSSAQLVPVKVTEKQIELIDTLLGLLRDDEPEESKTAPDGASTTPSDSETTPLPTQTLKPKAASAVLPTDSPAASLPYIRGVVINIMPKIKKPLSEMTNDDWKSHMQLTDGLLKVVAQVAEENPKQRFNLMVPDDSILPQGSKGRFPQNPKLPEGLTLMGTPCAACISVPVESPLDKPSLIRSILDATADYRKALPPEKNDPTLNQPGTTFNSQNGIPTATQIEPTTKRSSFLFAGITGLPFIFFTALLGMLKVRRDPNQKLISLFRQNRSLLSFFPIVSFFQKLIQWPTFFRTSTSIPASKQKLGIPGKENAPSVTSRQRVPLTAPIKPPAPPTAVRRLAGSSNVTTVAPNTPQPPASLDLTSRRQMIRTTLLTLGGLATMESFTPSASAAPWTPLQPSPAKEIPARFGPIIQLTESNLWEAVERNLDVKLAQLELWKQEAEGNRLKPSWNIELLGGLSGNKPVVGANISRTSYDGTLNLSGVYESKGLTLAADFAGALLKRLFGAKHQAQDLQQSLVLSIYYQLQQTVLEQYGKAADLFSKLRLNQKQIVILNAQLASYTKLWNLPLAPESAKDAAENRIARVEAGAMIKTIQADILKLETERKAMESELLPLVSDSVLDAGKRIEIKHDFDLTIQKALTIQKNGTASRKRASEANPSLLAALYKHQAAQQSLSLFNRTQKASLNLGSLFGTQRSNAPEMTGPVFHFLGGMPLETYGATQTENGLRLNIPLGGSITADRAVAQAQVADAETKLQQSRQAFALSYQTNFRTLPILLEQLKNQKESLAELSKLSPSGAQFKPNSDLEMRMKILNQIKMALMNIAETESQIIQLQVRLTVLGASPYPWEQSTQAKPKASSAKKRSEQRDQKTSLPIASQSITWKSILRTNQSDNLPASSKRVSVNRAHVVDASLLDVNGLAELAKSNPNAFWIFLFDPDSSEKKVALANKLRYQQNFRGILIQSANPFEDAALFVTKQKLVTDSIAVGMDERILQLSSKSIALRVLADRRFWLGKVRSPELQLQALKLVFETVPPPQLAKGVFSAESYLTGISDWLSRNMLATTKTATSV